MLGGMINSEPSSDDLMMVDEKSNNNNTFAAPINNYGNTIQQCFACDSSPKHTHGHFAYAESPRPQAKNNNLSSPQSSTSLIDYQHYSEDAGSTKNQQLSQLPEDYENSDDFDSEVVYVPGMILLTPTAATKRSRHPQYYYY